MSSNKTDIYVFAHWKGMSEPKLMGLLSAHQAKGRKTFSFEYAKEWINSGQQILVDPDIQFFNGIQYPNNKENFGVFFDSMPDTWGRTLMKRRAVIDAKAIGETPKTLYDLDFLLGVFDECRMGALRFKTSLEGHFLDDNAIFPTPPWTSRGELQEAVSNLENDHGSDAIKKWLSILLAPGSSLGGARPKANIRDNEGNLWIAKFPSVADDIDKASWEYMAYCMAVDCGIEMSECKIERLNHKHHTFFAKRFDREKNVRIHFASAMTMTGNNESTIKSITPSYMDLVDFIQNYGVDVNLNLHQLWKRIVFNIAISNTDDHLRNHGFLLCEKGWTLSPAYDINPSIDKSGLSLNIDTESNALDFELAKSVGMYFRLNEKEMDDIIQQVLNVVRGWRKYASKIGISKSEQDYMEGAFNF